MWARGARVRRVTPSLLRNAGRAPRPHPTLHHPPNPPCCTRVLVDGGCWHDAGRARLSHPPHYTPDDDTSFDLHACTHVKCAVAALPFVLLCCCLFSRGRAEWGLVVCLCVWRKAGALPAPHSCFDAGGAWWAWWWCAALPGAHSCSVAAWSARHRTRIKPAPETPPDSLSARVWHFSGSPGRRHALASTPPRRTSASCSLSPLPPHTCLSCVASPRLIAGARDCRCVFASSDARPGDHTHTTPTYIRRRASKQGWVEVGRSDRGKPPAARVCCNKHTLARQPCSSVGAQCCVAQELAGSASSSGLCCVCVSRACS